MPWWMMAGCVGEQRKCRSNQSCGDENEDKRGLIRDVYNSVSQRRTEKKGSDGSGQNNDRGSP